MLAVVFWFVGVSQHPDQRSRRVSVLTSQIQSFKMSYPNIYPMGELLEYTKGCILQI